MGKELKKYLPKGINWDLIHPNAFKMYFCKMNAIEVEEFLSNIRYVFKNALPPQLDTASPNNTQEEQVVLDTVTRRMIKSTIKEFFKNMNESQLECALYTWTGSKIL